MEKPRDWREFLYLGVEVIETEAMDRLFAPIVKESARGWERRGFLFWVLRNREGEAPLPLMQRPVWLMHAQIPLGEADAVPARLAVGYAQARQGFQALGQAEFATQFETAWPERERRCAGKHGREWEVYYEALLDEYTSRRIALARVAAASGQKTDALEALWLTNPEQAFARSVEGLAKHGGKR